MIAHRKRGKTRLRSCDVGDIIRSHKTHPSRWQIIDCWYEDDALGGIETTFRVEHFELRNLDDGRTCRAKGSMSVYLDEVATH